MKKKVTDTDAQITLPEQEKFFSTAKLRSSARAGTQLPDPTHAPYGYDAKTQYKHLFPALQLPALHPPAKYHPEDSVSFGSFGLPPHELYLGDNLYVLRQIPSESIDLIYIDPPFFSNRNYTQIWGDDNEVRSFGDIFQDGMYSYLAWLNARLWEMKRVLKSTGSVYVHCDYHASHYIKTEMDKIFGYDNFLNEIVWEKDAGQRVTTYYPRKHDVIFWYSKSQSYSFNWFVKEVRDEHNETATKMHFKNKDEFGTYRLYPNGKKFYLELGKMLADVWTDLSSQDASSPIMGEKIGYPTQKPEALLKRILSAGADSIHSKAFKIALETFLNDRLPSREVKKKEVLVHNLTNEFILKFKDDYIRKVQTDKIIPDTVADFFMGGGTTGAAALKLGFRFVGCDISRVAVSVSASRLVEIGEELSGITVREKTQKSMDFKEESVADIHTNYVGSYPTEKFAGMSQQEFSHFVLGLYEAVAFTGQSKWIHGLANGKLVISVGSPDPNQRVGMEQVKGVVEESLRQYEKQLAAGEEKIIQIIGWSFDPAVEIWKGQAITMLNKKGLKLQIDLVSLSSEAFRQKIFRHIGESNLDLKFNRLNQLLSFTSKPYAGTLRTEQKGLTLKFTLEGARPVGTGRLINCQWDFSYDGQRFASKEYALNREKRGEGDFEAILTIEHTFPAAGTYTIAARVQDNLDGEATVAMKLDLSEKHCSLSSL